MLNGWIGFPRALLSEPWYRDSPAFARALYLHLALSANFAPSVTRTGLALMPGQLVTSWATLADEMAGVENRRRSAPTLWKVRHAADLLRKAGTIAWTTARTTAGGGLVVTLTRWPLHESDNATTADATAETGATPLRELPQHRKNTTRPAEVQAERPMKELLREWEQKERESMRELREVRARERGEAVN